MRNSEPLQKDWHFYVADMIGCAKKVVTYTDGLDQEEFIASRLSYDATLRNLSMVSEAAAHMSKTCPHLLQPNQLAAGYWYARPINSQILGYH